MIDRLIHALVESDNEAADDLLLDALRLGTEPEQRVVLDALLRRQTSRGLGGVIARYDQLPESLRSYVLENLREFHHVLAECGRSDDTDMRLAAMKLIAQGRQGKLAYVLTENLHNTDETLSGAAIDAIVALASWVAEQTRKLQKSAGSSESAEAVGTYQELIAQRPELEAAVARAINLHRGKHGTELLRAALLLGDWPGSKTLAILQTSKHGGQSPMVRRLQQPPDSEHVEAFLLGASHGQLRSHFGIVFSRIEQAPVLDALLRRTHWVKDQQLALCLHQVSRGTWWGMGELARDIDRRTAADAAKIAEWLAVSGIHDVEQDDRMQILLEKANRDGAQEPTASLGARLRLLRIAMRRRRGSSVRLIRALLSDPDERVVRMAAREIVRRKPLDFENMLLKLMTGSPASVRRVVGRAIGQAGFEQYWLRFDRLEKSTRQSAGRAMLKLLPDAVQRLQGRAAAGPMEQRVKAMQIAQELGVAESLRHVLIQACADPHPRVRSKAVAVLGELPLVPGDLLVEKLLNDSDSRVRANAIEVLEARPDPKFLPILAARAATSSSRERANAIKAMHRMKVSTASTQLIGMLRDERPEHRMSALWALRQIGWWQLLNEVARLAREDSNLRVKRYALAILKNVAELLKERQKAGAG